MSTLVSRVLSHSDKLSIINNASSWLHHSSKKEEAMLDSSRRSSIEDYTYPSSEIYNNNNNNPQSFTPTASPRYSMAPPPYENVLKETTIENKRFGNALSTIWKRASFSSSGNTANDIKMTPPQTTTQIDKKQMEHAITLINVATDMNNSGNQQMAIDLYMMGLDKLISALPLESDPSVKSALEQKIVELKERNQLNLISLNDLINKQKEEEDDDQEAATRPIRAQISNLVINAAVLSAVALKKSPIPDTLSSVMNYAVDSMQFMDEKHQIRKRTWDLAATSIAKAVEIDRQFEIHQMLTGAVYTGFTAFVKAGMAYAETPGHNVSGSSSSKA